MKTKLLQVRVDEELLKFIEDKAIKSNKTRSEFIRDSIMNTTIVKRDIDTPKLIAQFKYIGNNINQITKKIHQSALNAKEIEYFANEINFFNYQFNKIYQEITDKHKRNELQ